MSDHVRLDDVVGDHDVSTHPWHEFLKVAGAADSKTLAYFPMFQADNLSRMLDSMFNAEMEALQRAPAKSPVMSGAFPWGDLPGSWKFVGLLALAVYVFSAVAAALIAHNKGRSGVGWFALALVIGPLAVAFAMIALPAAAERALVGLGTARRD